MPWSRFFLMGRDWRKGVFYFKTLLCNFPLEGEHFILIFATKSVSWRGEVFYLNFFKALTSEFLEFYTVFILTMLSWQLHESIVKITLLPWAGQGSPYTGGTCIWWMICTIHIGQGLWLISAVSHQYPAVAAWAPDGYFGHECLRKFTIIHCADWYKQTCSCCNLLHCLPVILNEFIWANHRHIITLDWRLCAKQCLS